MADKKEQVIHNQYIVGIGASAGGLEAILELFDHIPSDVPCSFIIIQHLSPDYKSMMPELLEKHTQMKIYEAEDGMLVKPNAIYVIPHKKNMTFRLGKLLLTDKEASKAPNTAIDIFLKSLAEDKKEKAIGIILSGTGTDGTKGLEAIKQANGLTIVQDPISCKFDGMANSAINAGLADFVLPPELIQEEILNYIQTDKERFRTSPITEQDEAVILDILALIKSKIGIDFTHYKRPTISRRISKRMSFLNIKEVAQYKDFLFQHTEEIQFLHKEFLIGVTRFFRDEKSFEKLRELVIPNLFAQKSTNQEVKIWVAGCSTGEEAYTMAILVYEYMAKHNRHFEVKVFATDLDKQAIEQAARGCYSLSIAKELSPVQLDDHFEQIGEKYKVLPHIRKMVVFAQHDLVRNAPYSKVDLVSCRNVLIYLNPALQKSILAKFQFSLNHGGYLFLGPSENLGDFEHMFEEIDKKWKIYRNKNTTKTGQIDGLGTLGSVNLFMTEGASYKSDKANTSTLNRTQSLNDILLAESNFSAVYINEHYELVQAAGNYQEYLHLPANNFDLNILKMVVPDLSVALSSGLRKAVKTHERIALKGIRLRKEQTLQTVDLVIVPVSDRKVLKKFYWVVFKKGVLQEKQKETSHVFQPADTEVQERITEMEYELRETKERLQTAIEDLESSNEEMQSANEELVSANEELQSTNEELQSLNEELHTVNAEHQLKIKELIDLNDDLNNYFRSTDIGQVFVDKYLTIRKFSPAVVEQLNLIESDIGRPLSHISNNISYDGIVDDVQKVITSGRVTQNEIITKNGKWFSLKILPYIRQDKTTEGAIITFVDINDLKNVNQLLTGVLNSSISAILAFKAIRNHKEEIIDFECVSGNDACEKVLKSKFQDLLGKKMLSDVSKPDQELFNRYKKVVESGEPLHIEYFVEELDRWLEIAAVKMQDGLAITFQDITEKKNAEEKIRIAYEELKKTQSSLRKLNNELEERVQERTKELMLSKERFQTLSLATNDAIWDWDFASNTVWWNEGFKNLFGYTNSQLETGVEAWFNRIHPEDKARVVDGIQEVISNEQKSWAGEYRLRKADGSFAHILDRAYVLHHDDHMPYRMIGSMMDLTHLKNVQTELEQTNQNLLKINADLDNFIYTASHDLKAPISNIEGLMDALHELIPQEDQEIKEILEMVGFSLKKFKETIEGLTDVVRIQKAHANAPEILLLRDLINDVALSIKDMFVKSGAQLEFDLEVEQVQFTKKNLRSIFYNLLSNAIKYRHLDRTPMIKITTRQEDNYILISVTDNGLGIEKSKLPKIFGMFERLHTHVEGTGIGLYIVKRIIENADGKIEVHSTLGKGTTFQIYLKNLPSSQIHQFAHDTSTN